MGKVIKKKDSSVIERRFGVVLESIDSNVKQILEGHAALGKKIDMVAKDLAEFREEVNYKFNVVFEELRDLKTGRITDLEKRVNLLEERLTKSHR